MLPALIDRILVDLVDDPRQSRGLADFITHHRAGYRSQFEFKNPGQYYDYVRRSELRTLSGDLVKSFEELEIANFLTQNGVDFRYERPFPFETASPRHRQYRPDFYLPRPRHLHRNTSPWTARAARPMGGPGTSTASAGSATSTSSTGPG